MSDSGGVSPWGPPGSVPSKVPMGPPVTPTGDGGPVSPPIGVPGPAAVGLAGTVPELSFESAPVRGRRSRLAVGGILVGVLAVGVAGVFAVAQLRGDSGGAASPEAVGEEFMAAMEQEDVLGLIDLLLPGERDVFREPMMDLVSELSRLEVLSADATLADVAGLDIEMTNESTDVEPTNVSDISNITMSATLSASVDGDQLPIGDLIRDLAGDGFSPSDLDQPAATEEFSLPMTVVQDDGRWYVSVLYTAAESLRAQQGDPIPEAGLVPSGGADPGGAIDVLLDGVEQLDIAKIISAINPNEAAALQRYAPLFIPDADGLAREVALDWQVTRTDYDVAGSGSKRFVTINAIRIDGTAEETAFSVELAAGCLVIEAEGERVDTCDLAAAETDTPATLDEIFGGSLGISALTAAFEEAFADYRQPGIVVDEVDGEWFVSPMGSGFEQMLALMRALDRDEIDRLVEAVATFVGDLQADFESFPFPDDAPTTSGGDDASADFDEYEAEQNVAEVCYELDAIEEVTSCLIERVEAGALSDYYVGVELRFPECGLAAASLGRDPLFTMSDDEYTALIATSATCFEALIERGEVERSEVSPEYLKPECGEGRNPWSFEVDDDEFFDRWVECIYS